MRLCVVIFFVHRILTWRERKLLLIRPVCSADMHWVLINLSHAILLLYSEKFHDPTKTNAEKVDPKKNEEEHEKLVSIHKHPHIWTKSCEVEAVNWTEWN